MDGACGYSCRCKFDLFRQPVKNSNLLFEGRNVDIENGV